MRLRRLALAALLLLAAAAARGETLFYQPQSRDARWSAAQWQAIWRASRAAGVDRLIVQWTSHGDEDFGGASGWLRASLAQAAAAGLQLVVGLHHDPDYFRRSADAADLDLYWQRLLAESARQHARLRDWQLPVAGWYLPAELDDRTFADPARRAQLTARLGTFAARLERPLHLSAFSAGQLTPAAYAAWLDGLRQAGLQPWWQDGAGTAALPAGARAAYRDALPCAVGVIHEAFRQTSAAGQPFRAEPREPAADSGCHPRAVFSLRYRPWARQLDTPP